MRYFYVAFFLAPGGMGSMILKQNSTDPGKPENGFNIATATKYLNDTLKIPSVITNWQETTEQRAQEWGKYLNSQPCPCGQKHGPVMHALPGGNEGPSAPPLSRDHLKPLKLCELCNGTLKIKHDGQEYPCTCQKT